MTSLIQQSALLPAGCQPWNLNMVCGCGPNFVYCATLAVYIYEYDTTCGIYKLTSINASHSKTVTCISWSRDHIDLFATAGADEKICIWDVGLRKCIKTRTELGYVPICVGWIPGKAGVNVLAFCGSQGPIQLWNIVNNGLSQVDYTTSFDCEITLFRWHHSETAKLVIGHVDGSLTIHISGKRSRHILKAITNATSKNSDPVLEAIWDPLSCDYLLVARKQSGIQLIDVKALTVITRFNMPSKLVSAITISWVHSAPGMFLTGDRESGVLRLWSVSQSIPLESINLKATGFQCLTVLEAAVVDVNSRKGSLGGKTSHEFLRFRESSVSSGGSRTCAVPPAKIVCAFVDGGIGLYNLQMKKWEFFREQGHIETIFDCKFKPSDPKMLATASFDGTIKIWSSIDLSPIGSSSGNEGVIYSVSWAPGEQNCIACGTRRRGVFIWDIDKHKLIKRFKEHGTSAVYCVAWNQLDPQRLASCAEDGLCIVRDILKKEVITFRHPDSAFGCEWNYFDKNLIATGCNDGNVRVWSVASGNTEPQQCLSGHSGKVFHVRWHPLLKNLICSGSDDNSIRVWNYEIGNCTATLNGHTSAVRGLCWNFEIPYLLASGSWDSSLRLWDVREEKCLDIVTDHGADVYGLTSHPNNPFTLATSSRDSTLRLWSLSQITKPLFLQIISGVDGGSVVASPEEAMKHGTPLKLAGVMSKEIVARLHDRKNYGCVQLRWFSDLFSSSVCLTNLWDLANVVRGQKESTLSSSYKDGIVHTKHLTKYKSAEAHLSEHKEFRKGSVGSQHRNKDIALARIANLYLNLGDMKHYCDILVQAGQWERAIAHAPSVSLSYWSELVTRYADTLRSDEETDCVSFYVATGNISEAVHCLTLKNEYQDALLLAQSAVEGNTPAMVSNTSEEASAKKVHHDSFNDLVSNCCNVLATRFYSNGDPYKAASIFLSQNNATFAINCLVKSNKLEIALCLSQYLDKRFDGSVTAAKLLARTCERNNPSIAIKLLEQFDPCCEEPDQVWTSLHGLCARNDESDFKIKENLHRDAGLPSPFEFQQRAEKFEKNSKPNQAMMSYLLGTTPEKGLELGVSLLLKRLSNDVDWTVDDVLDELSPAFSICERILRMNSNKELKSRLLAISSYFGALLAYRRRYDHIVAPMYNYAISLCELCQKFDPKFPLSPSELRQEINSIQTRDKQDKRSDVLERIKYRAGTELIACMMGSAIATISELPSHSDTYVSTISKAQINGGAFMLEDQRSVLSYNEAIMWAKCNEFSPTSSGARICPF